jgi:rhodanese-related sulfurtransferase
MTKYLRDTWKKVYWQVPAILIIAGGVSLVVNGLRSDGLVLVADRPTEARPVTASGDALVITLEEAENLFLRNAAVFMDARNPAQYESGHIRGAINLPWSRVDEHVIEITEGFNPEKHIITYCDGVTCALSKNLALYLRDMGFVSVRVLVNGWTLWKNTHLPVEPGG